MITSFNDMMKKLESSGSEESKIGLLAENLLAKGIAKNESEARNKAEEIIMAEKRSIDQFSNKKDKLTQYNDPRSDPEYYRKQNIKEFRRRALERRKPIRIQSKFQTPMTDKKKGLGPKALNVLRENTGNKGVNASDSGLNGSVGVPNTGFNPLFKSKKPSDDLQLSESPDDKLGRATYENSNIGSGMAGKEDNSKNHKQEVHHANDREKRENKNPKVDLTEIFKY